jgi:hypothetical protein
MPNPPVILACVLECSSIAAMVYLTAVVVLTRIGVNKDLPDPEPPKPSKPLAPPRPATPVGPPRRATPGEVALMVGVLVVVVAGTLTIAAILARWL